MGLKQPQNIPPSVPELYQACMQVIFYIPSHSVYFGYVAYNSVGNLWLQCFSYNLSSSSETFPFNTQDGIRLDIAMNDFWSGCSELYTLIVFIL